VWSDAKSLELFGSRFGAGRVVATVQVGGDRQAGLGGAGVRFSGAAAITVAAAGVAQNEDLPRSQVPE